MRSMVIMLLLTLVGPSMTHVVCGLACTHGQNRAPAEAPATCHDQGAGGEGYVLTSGQHAGCHEQSDMVIAVRPGPQFPAAPGAVPLPAALSGGSRPPEPSTVPDLASRPPILVRLTTPLRI